MSTFNMYGGEISDNTEADYDGGGGVYWRKVCSA